MPQSKSLFAFRFWVFGCFLVFGFWFLVSPAHAKEYDGIWFLGFNLHKPLGQSLPARQAINLAISKEVSAAGIIPPGMLGYDPDLEPQTRDLKAAKQLMKQAGFPVNDKRLKNISLLHTDGVKTIQIARQIKNNLANLGLKIELVEVSYLDEEQWGEKLESGKYDLFLMGYKAGMEQMFTTEAATEVDSYSLVEPLFKTKGEANFTEYTNKSVDKLLDQLTGINMALKTERHKKLKEIAQIVNRDRAVIVLFYIEKL